MKSINVGVIGFGTVGQGLWRVASARSEAIQAQLGLDLKITRVVDLELGRAAELTGNAAILTTRWQDVIEDPAIDIVVELIGGAGLAKEIALAALRAGKALVTANKYLLASAGGELLDAAHDAETLVGFEASVAGAIPIIHVVRDALQGAAVSRIAGILNGTSHFILTMMSEHGVSYEAALSQAQRLGYAEADPSFDVDGWDAAHKLGILSALVFGTGLPAPTMSVKGIRDVRTQDVEAARKLGFALKLVAMAERETDRYGATASNVTLSVEPMAVPLNHALGGLSGVINGVEIVSPSTGPLFLSGAGAGGLQTGTAVYADTVRIGLQRAHGSAQSTGAWWRATSGARGRPSFEQVLVVGSPRSPSEWATLLQSANADTALPVLEAASQEHGDYSPTCVVGKVDRHVLDGLVANHPDCRWYPVFLAAV